MPTRPFTPNAFTIRASVSRKTSFLRQKLKRWYGIHEGCTSPTVKPRPYSAFCGRNHSLSTILSDTTLASYSSVASTMPSKEQDIFDISYIFDSIDSITEAIEAHFDSVSRSLKDTFRASPWLPDSIKPRPPPPAPHRMPSIPVGYYAASQNWVSEHRAVAAAIFAFIGTGAFIIWRRRRSDRAKRRAKRAKNGSRTEVVVLAGSSHSPLTRSLAQELERRGFIVYIPVSSLSEEQLVQSESRADIRPLNMDITSVRFLLFEIACKRILIPCHSRHPPKKQSRSLLDT